MRINRGPPTKTSQIINLTMNENFSIIYPSRGNLENMRKENRKPNPREKGENYYDEHY